MLVDLDPQLGVLLLEHALVGQQLFDLLALVVELVEQDLVISLLAFELI